MRRRWTAAAGAVITVVVVVLTATACSTMTTTPDDVGPNPASSTAQPGHDASSAPAHHHTPGMEMPSAPSEAATMVCTHITAEAVHRLAAPAKPPPRESTWDGQTFTCTYLVPAGEIVLSVFDTTDVADGQQHFDALRAHTSGAKPITGMAAFALPAFETGKGVVAFLKDNKTLKVDTTQLATNAIGPDRYTRGQLAYALAAAVIACWTG